jgi:hypothetical protein
MRKTIQSHLRETRTQLRHHIHDLGDATEPVQFAEREQLQLLAAYATGIQTALNLEGNRPFAYPGLAGFCMQSIFSQHSGEPPMKFLPMRKLLSALIVGAPS